MAFHEVRFPADLSFGAVGGPERRTEIVALANGHEERNTPWAGSRRRWDAGLGMRSLEDLHALVTFFEARSGQLHGFRWKDWSDFRSCSPSTYPSAGDQEIGVGDGQRTVFDLTKAYGDGGARYDRAIRKPVPGTVRVAVDGVEMAEGTDWTCDSESGTVRLIVPPADGMRVTAGFEFDVPVRFDTDRLSISLATFEAGQAPEVPVIEVLS